MDFIGLPRLPSSTELHIVDNITVSLPLHISSTTSSNTSSDSTTVVEVEQLINALSREISELRAELAAVRDKREKELRSNILTYIQALPEQELIHLTADVSDDVVIAMEMLVKSMIEKVGITNVGDKENVILQIEAREMFDICLLMIARGYKVREYKALQEGVSLA